MKKLPDVLSVDGLPTNRDEAISQGARRYFNGDACPAGHIGPRYTLSGGCVECQREFNRADRERARANMKGRK